MGVQVLSLPMLIAAAPWPRSRLILKITSGKRKVHSILLKSKNKIMKFRQERRHNIAGI
jgi:hypothetical protein